MYGLPHSVEPPFAGKGEQVFVHPISQPRYCHHSSAIDFFVTVDKVKGVTGEDRVVVTFNGKVSGRGATGAECSTPTPVCGSLPSGLVRPTLPAGAAACSSCRTWSRLRRTTRPRSDGALPAPWVGCTGSGANEQREVISFSLA